jgi:alpha-glucoside transport system permease protein
VAFLTVYLAYPVFATLWLSLLDKDGGFVGVSNYTNMLAEPKFWESLKNNMLWLIVVPALPPPSACWPHS